MAACLVTGCYKDKGNYDYHPINAAAISNIPDTIYVQNGDSVHIKPGISFLQSPDDSNYTFKWAIVGGDNQGSPTKIMSTEKNLHGTIPFSLGNYPAFFQIKEKSTGITWQKAFRIYVQGAIKSKGWLIFSEVSNNARLDFWEEDVNKPGVYPVVYQNFTSRLADPTTLTPFTLPGKPRSLGIYGTRFTASESASKNWILLSTDDHTEMINISDGFIWKATKYNFKVNTSTGRYPDKPEWIIPQYGGQAYAYQDKNFFANSSLGVQPFGVPVNIVNGLRFDAAPFFATQYSNVITGMGLLWDLTNKRFLRYNGEGASTCAVIAAPDNGTGFDPNNMAMQPLWIGYTPAANGQGISMLKDAGGKFYLARFTWNSSNKITPLSLEEVDLTGLKDAQLFAVDENYGYLFYAVDNKVYRYNMDTHELILFKAYAAGMKISMLKSRRCYSLPPWALVLKNTTITNYKTLLEPALLGIFVGVYNPSSPDNSGVMDVLRVTNSTAQATSYYTLLGGGKIVDAEYIYY